eukprot:TRINITY_DN40595_c0_g1_i2.p1 TRINITY_DN40595_c0_g1~~TRINITY_DN40595_c0_g1_i2.p1  ORF type:complete len:145 (+),score=20.06 TRINITY_DN40595_c0_g1_i2:1-435(+)
MVFKGASSFVDAYSCFFDNMKQNETCLKNDMKKGDITDVFICGLVTDICVAWTAFHALELGFRTVLIEDACRGISPQGVVDTFNKITESNGLVVKSGEVKAMARGKDRRPELGYKLAVEYRKTVTYPIKNKNSRYNIEPSRPNQ